MQMPDGSPDAGLLGCSSPRTWPRSWGTDGWASKLGQSTVPGSGLPAAGASTCSQWASVASWIKQLPFMSLRWSETVTMWKYFTKIKCLEWGLLILFAAK